MHRFCFFVSKSVFFTLMFALLITSAAIAENMVEIDCPINVPNPNGDSVAIPIYISNDINLSGFSLGFNWNSSDIEVTSVDTNGTILPNGMMFQKTFYPGEQKILVGGIDFSGSNPVSPQAGGFLCRFWVQIPAGTDPQCVDFDSCFIPPAGTFVFSPQTGGSITPNFYDCGPGDINIGGVDDCYPPVVSDIPDQTVNEGESFATINLDDYVEDETNPDNEIDWTYAGNVELGVSIDGSRIATITIPHAYWNGEETIIFTATDPYGNWDSDDAIFKVNSVPDPPVAPDTTVSTPEDIDLVSTLPGYDYDEEPLIWTILTGPFNGTITSFNSATGDYTYDPDDDYFGPDSLTYQVSDGTWPSVSGKVNINVTEVNDPPVVSDIPDQNITEGGSFTTINLDSYVSDVDNNVTEMVWTYSGNTELDVQIDVNRIATIVIPHPDWFGAETITFRATDPGGEYDSDPATFTATGTPDPPHAPDTTVTTPEDIDLVSTLPGYDVDNEPLTWTILTGPFNGSIADFDPPSGDYIYDPDENYFGPDSLTYELDDGTSPPDTGVVRISVTPVNDAPEVADIPDQEVAEGGAFATINLDDYVTDVESTPQEMIWTYSGNVELAVSIDGSRVATISIPNSDWYGVETITFRATDPGSEFDTDPATFTVTNINDDPVVSDIPDQTVPEGGSFTTINLDDYVTDIDDPDDQIDWTYAGNVELSVSINVNRVATITIPHSEWSGIETITFTATDTAGAFDSDDAIFEVTAENDPPVVSDIPDQTLGTGGTFDPINLDDYVVDPDNPDEEIIWTYSGNIELIVTIDEFRVATVDVPGGWFGTETITFTATDPGGLYDSDDATFNGVMCGDVNGDGVVDISDVIYLINYIFLYGPAPVVYAAGDVNCDSIVDISDVVYLLDYIFRGGPEPCADC